MGFKGVGATAILCAALVFSRAETVQAQRASSSNSGDYLTLLMIGSVAKVDDVSVTSGTIQERNTDDTTAALGLALGYNWAKKGLPIRSEVEYHFRIRFDFDTRVLTAAGYENQLETHALFVNGYYDSELSDTWALFAGGGIGWAQNVSVVSRTPIGAGSPSERTDRSDNFAWNAGLGAIWSFAENWDAEFKYRYVSLGEVVSGPHTSGRTITADNYTSHDLIIGITYRF